jgi:hypothetical protein
MVPEHVSAVAYVANATIILFAIVSISFSLLPVPGTVVTLLVSFGLQTVVFFRSLVKPTFSEITDEITDKLDTVMKHLKEEGKVSREQLALKINYELREVAQLVAGERVLGSLETKGHIKQSFSDEKEKMEKLVEWVPASKRVLVHLSNLWRR